MKNSFVLWLSLLVFGLPACSKNDTSKESDGHALYIDAGYDDIAGNRVRYKNGSATIPEYQLQIRGPLFVDGNDIYYPAIGGYYKNDVLVPISGAKEVNSIFVKDGVVYAAGSRVPEGATYWKDGLMVKLQPDSSNYKAILRKITVAGSNNDVYVGGNTYPGDTHAYVSYWKNQVLHVLEKGNFDDMAVSGMDVHVVGSLTIPDGGAYWKNDVKQILTGFGNQKPSGMTSVSIWNNDVYITGGHGCALYWKNGQAFIEVNPDAYPTGVVVDNGEIIVGVNQGPAQGPGADYIMQIWKGNIPQTWGTGLLHGIYLGN